MTVGELIVTLGLDSSQFNKGLDDAKKNSLSLGGILKNALSFAGGMAIWDGIKNGIKSSIGAGIEFNATMQQNEVAFTTMLGSAQKAHSLMTQLLQMASKTPFETSDLTQAAQTLMSFGVTADQVMPTIKMLGDVSQGNRERFNQLALAFAQIQANGRLTGQDLLQLVNAGFNPLKIISEQTGKSMAELRDEMSKGKISAQDVENAFKIATSAGGQFYNAMQNQSGTFNGSMSTLKDNLNITFGTIMKPVFDWLTNTALPKAIDLTNKFSEGFQSGGLKGGLEAIFPPSLKPTIDGIFNTVSKLINFIKTNGPTIISILGGIVTGFLAFRAVTFIQNIPTMLQGLRTAILGVNAAMAANPIGIVISLITALVATIIYLWNTNEGFRNAIITAWNAIKTSAKIIWNGIKVFFLNLWDSIKNTAMSAWNGFRSKMTNLWNNIVQGAKDIWNGLINWFKALPSRLYNIAVSMFNRMRNGVTSTVGNVRTAIVNGINSAIDWLKSLPSRALQWGRNLINGFANGIKSAIGAVRKAVSSVAQKIRDFIGFHSPAKEGPASDADTWAPNLITMFANGINSTAYKVKDSVNGVAQTVKNGFQSVVDNLSTVIDIIDKQFQLWQLQTNANSDSIEYLTKEIEMNKEKLDAYSVQIAATNKLLDDAAKQYGVNSQQVIQYRDKLLDLQLAQAKLAQETEKANEALRKQSQYAGLHDIYGKQITSSSSKNDYVTAVLMRAAEQGRITTQQFIEGIKSLPKFASGGIVTSPTLALVGEAGPEAIVPLSGASGGNLQQTIHDATYQATYQALTDVMKVKSVSNSDNKEIAIRIDAASSNMLARILLPAIIREGQRQGLNLILQGVTN